MGTDKHGLEKRKAALRSRIRARLGKISAAKRVAAALKICARLKEQPFFQTAAAILFFAPLPDEADVWPLFRESLAAGKIVALPQFDAAAQNYVARRVQNLQTEIMTGQFWVREPKSACVKIPLEKFDLVLVPGTAFDLRGNRLGRGKGFYDRLLQDVRGLKIGIAFDEQVVKEVPAGQSDVPVDFILTPSHCAEAAR
jgi:5-formyltetrahydrofolate cyclo-ligase